MENQELLTIDEIAEKLKLKKSFFYHPYHRKGPDAIPCFKVGKKFIRYRLSDVMAWIEKQNEARG
jgi:excisionase family DNA binding protein